MVELALFLILVVLYSVARGRLATTVISGPMVFFLGGFLAFVAFQPALEVFPDWVVTEPDPFFLLVGEIALALVLFSEATHIKLGGRGEDDRLVARLLLIAMPLAILAGTAGAMGLLGLSIWSAAILATILAPTDASLGLAVVQSKRVPHVVRQTLQVEGSLNDGLAVPLLLLFISLSSADATGDLGSWIGFVAREIGLGALIGLAVGWLGGRLLIGATKRGWMQGRSPQLALLSMGLLAWTIAHETGGNGFIAAFVCGVGFLLAYRKTGIERPSFDESWVDLPIYFVFFYFGASMASTVDLIVLDMVLYAILSLTLVRMLPTAISFIGAGLRPASTLFIGWFGPRGLASIILGLIYLQEVSRDAIEAPIVITGMVTVTLSIFAHGISTRPGIDLYARRLTDLKPNELESVPAED
jgi:NhaP-type Na+/H+ or K+/H+ antiporter